MKEFGEQRAKMKKGVYRPLDFFMFRSPLLPFHVFEQLQCKESLQAWAQNPTIREAVAIASPSLFEDIENMNKGDKRKQQQIQTSLMRYLSRMATRSTPFGILAGLSIGKMDDDTEVKLQGFEKHRKRTRPDMEWLLTFIYRLEQRPEVVQKLRVMKNHIIQYSGGRLILPFSSECGQKRNNNNEIRESISIQASEPVMQALDYAKSAVLFADLIKYLKDLYPNVKRQRIQHMLWQLFQQEYLISSLRPPLTIAEPLQYVIDQLDGIEEAIDERTTLCEIQNRIKEYDALPIGQGLEKYLDLNKKMENIVPSRSQVQVDMRLASQSIKLNRQVGEEVAKAAELLWRLSLPQRGVSHLKNYHRDFLEKYGTRREIPVLELLNEETGLGAPSPYQYPKSSRKNDDLAHFSKEKESLLLELIQQALATRNVEVKLTDGLLERLEERKVNEEEAPASLELYVEIMAPSATAIDRGKYRVVITPTTASQRISQSFGRFMDLLKNDEIEQIEEVIQREKALYPHALLVEGAFLPPSGRSANVALGPSLLDDELSLGTNPKIIDPLTLDDVYVGASLERLYLKSRKYNKEIIVTSGNMLNHTQAPNVYRFMREVSLENRRNVQPFFWGEYESGPFLPRVTYGKTVIYPATWNVTLERLGLQYLNTEQAAWDEAIRLWRQDWMVPRHVYITYADNRVLLDLEQTDHVKQIKKEIQQGKSVTLKEHVGLIEERWVEGPGGFFSQECLIPVEKNLDRMPVSPVLYQNSALPVSYEDRVRLPGSDWLFAKLYVSQNRQDDFIPRYMWEFAEGMVKAGTAKKWFFIRYVDPEPHIRLRFQGFKEDLVGNILPALSKWADPLVSDGIMQRLVIDTYEREIERYGGSHLIGDAENVFAADSKLVAQFLRLVRSNEVDIPPVEIAALAIVDMLENYGLTFTEQLELLDTIVSKDDYRKEFRLRRKELGRLLDPQNRKSLGDIRNGHVLYTLMEQRAPFIIDFGNKVRAEIGKGSLSNTPHQILGSLIHMHCNRFMDVDRSKEVNALAFARHTLYSQKYRREKENGDVYAKY